MKPPDKIKAVITDLIFYLSILFFIVGFNFSDNMTGGWYQQLMPNLGGKTIQDMEFLDSLIGYATARQTGDTSYVLKTTNGGDNWQIIYRNFFSMTNIQFLNTQIGYSCGAYLYKTTNGGYNWIQINAPPISPQELFALNQDTIWLVQSESLIGGVYRTTNGGANWERQLYLGFQNPDHIYMFNARIGFISRESNSTSKTTNGGLSWFVISSTDDFNDIYFIDSLTGWASMGLPKTMKKTTDGGLTWQQQAMPNGGGIFTSTTRKFSNVNKDTIWAIGGQIIVGNNARGIIYKTTNGGSNWGFQLPDTSINIFIYYHIDFINKLNGWSYSNNPTGVHTTTGGDDTTFYYTGVEPISNKIPSEFNLYQNYPNPFNPVTKIKFSISKSAIVNIKVYDIQGRSIADLINDNIKPGEYETEFYGSGLASGIYFYSLYADNVLIDTKKMLLIK